MYGIVGANGLSEHDPQGINQSIHKAKMNEAIKGKKQLPHGAKKT